MTLRRDPSGMWGRWLDWCEGGGKWKEVKDTDKEEDDDEDKGADGIGVAEAGAKDAEALEKSKTGSSVSLAALPVSPDADTSWPSLAVAYAPAGAIGHSIPTSEELASISRRKCEPCEK